jgi:gluconolactonase
MKNDLSRVLCVLALLSGPLAAAQPGADKPGIPLPASPAPAEPAGPSALDTIVEAGVKPERLARGTEFKFLEGPVWVPAKGSDQGGFLLFSDIPADTIYKWTPAAGLTEGQPSGKLDTFLTPSRHSNGLMLDGKGNLLICEHERRVVRLEGLDTGKLTVRAETFEGKKLNSPNDLEVHSGGAVYFTDPPYGLGPSLGKAGTKELDYHGVFRIAPDGTLALVTKDLKTPNGIALSPDEKLLYIADMGKAEVRVFDVKPDGSIDNNRLFAKLEHNGRGAGGDGVRVDTVGNVYIAARGGVWVFDPAGEKLGVIPFPQNPANLCFGGADMKTMYVTAQSGLYRLAVKVAGKP